jgi:hypothetical protein
MSLTTAELVAGLIEVDADISLDPFIATATAFVSEIPASAGLATERLELIERYLSAHFYTHRDPRPVSERAGPVSAEYQSKVDLNLSTSHYGQTAMMLDTSGTLATLSRLSKRVGGVTWLGQADDRGAVV